MRYAELMRALRSMGSEENVKGMARFGISSKGTLGIPVTELRKLAKSIGKDQELSLKLWASGIHEARILASLIGEKDEVTESQMEEWVKDFDSWDVCDGVCGNLFDKTPFAYEKAAEWSEREEEFVKRAGFVMMAELAVHDKEAGDDRFMGFLPMIEAKAGDGRNFVAKAVNWALRQIGKRNPKLRRAAIKTARRIGLSDQGRARWIASDALRELERT